MPALIDYLVVILLVALSGLFSGLTLGLMSLNTFELRRKMKLGNKDAKKVYPLRKKGNLLLSTLLLGNVAVNSAIAIFLGSIASGLIAGIVATGLIVIFGEIMPQAVFSRFALSLGAKTTWLVYIFLVILYPVTKPISLVLDKTLGAELPTVYSKKEFQEILAEQKDIKDSGITHKEFRILRGGLVYSREKVEDVMTPRVKAFSVQKDDILDPKKMSQIFKAGYSRIPVTSKTEDKIVGILYTKDLISIDPEDKIPVKKIMRKKVCYIKESDHLGTVLSKFRKEKIHLFIVKDKFGGVAGVITLEDVLEEIVGEIVDEHDSKTDTRK